jgi:DNA polymerase III epsilon subunit-like protein
VGLGVDHAVILDTEFLTNEDSFRRMWNGPDDPDPVVVQIGAVRLALQGDFAIDASFSQLVCPVDRFGQPIGLHPAFTALTGIDAAAVAAQGQPLAAALAAFDAFSEGAPIWSWGKDELNMIAISTWIAGLPPPIPAHRFGNACHLLLRAGVPLDTVKSLRSHSLCAHFSLTPPAGRAHDAAHDARCVATVLRHLLVTGQLAADNLHNTAP